MIAENVEAKFEEKYSEAMEIVREYGAVISYAWLQRKLGIDFATADRILKRMKREEVKESL